MKKTTLIGMGLAAGSVMLVAANPALAAESTMTVADMVTTAKAANVGRYIGAGLAAENVEGPASSRSRSLKREQGEPLSQRAVQP